MSVDIPKPCNTVILCDGGSHACISTLSRDAIKGSRVCMGMHATMGSEPLRVDLGCVELSACAAHELSCASWWSSVSVLDRRSAFLCGVYMVRNGLQQGLDPDRSYSVAGQEVSSLRSRLADEGREWSRRLECALSEHAAELDSSRRVASEAEWNRRIWRALPLDIFYCHVLQHCDIDTRISFKARPQPLRDNCIGKAPPVDNLLTAVLLRRGRDTHVTKATVHYCIPVGHSRVLPGPYADRLCITHDFGGVGGATQTTITRIKLSTRKCRDKSVNVLATGQVVYDKFSPWRVW
jgi:hypothetical protein